MSQTPNKPPRSPFLTPTERITVALRFGRTREARFAGEPKAVLIALFIVMLSLIAIAYLAATATVMRGNGALSMWNLPIFQKTIP